MLLLKRLCLAAVLLGTLGSVAAQDKPAVHYDAELAKSLGANDMGMRNYVLVILKTGPNKMPEGEGRKKFVATDPVIVHGEMVAEYHKFFD
jgi:hypothetical protein